jgi:hypothetical protein
MYIWGKAFVTKKILHAVYTKKSVCIHKGHNTEYCGNMRCPIFLVSLFTLHSSPLKNDEASYVLCRSILLAFFAESVGCMN